MSKREIALNQLSLWFESQKRVLPWRNDPSPYRVWVSE
ncbi:A/G-specific adenine glycosylase, partial [bacterium]|nr:A/G-specific adenine glycosylase [bacterium]